MQAGERTGLGLRIHAKPVNRLNREYYAAVMAVWNVINLLGVNNLVEAGGVGLCRRVDNRQLIDFSSLTIRPNLSIHAKLERNWNIAFSSPASRTKCKLH